MHAPKDLALAPGFNPLSLPDAAPPVPGARTWQWLAEQIAGQTGPAVPRDPARATSALEAYLARFVAGSGTADPGGRDLALRPRPREEVVASHLDQDVVFAFHGAPRVTVRLSAAAPEQPAGGFPFTGPVAIIGTVPPAIRAVQAHGRDLREELQAHLAADRTAQRRAVAADRRRRWAEDALLVDYTDGAAVRFAARLHLQPFLTVWRPRDGGPDLDVVDLDRWQTEDVVASARAALGRLEHRPCPMIPGAGSADLCKMPGGPWTSGSIAAAARWERTRERMLRALGCDTCGDGAIKVFLGRVGPGARHTRDVGIGAGARTRHDEPAATDQDA